MLYVLKIIPQIPLELQERTWSAFSIVFDLVTKCFMIQQKPEYLG